MRYFFSLLLGIALGLPVSASPWETVKVPSQGESESIGTYNNGCLAGAEPLPLEGEGYQVMRSQRGRYYGHESMIRFLHDLSNSVHKLELGQLLVGDIAMPRGGRFSSGHNSHQTGLDADIWLKLSDGPLSEEELIDVQPLPMVHIKQYKINKKNWGEQQALMVQLAAADERVARIFVHPVIKEQLCQREWTDRTWLQKVRPWWGHYYHFHVRLHCPDGDSNCKAQPAPPAGDGCGAELASWKPKPKPKREKVAKVKKKPKAKPIPPSQCLALLRKPSEGPN
ncbi:penicillin-insensitive murein endopeptidase [Photobacterium gaetbulicola]|uniref:Penicillin-insensitive murein endopeptidase n=1 Tax=Photobacterium gaetbulicola Gung47 TaxID=658445 RepID=A0A0C5WXP6_9GAMM|nr:penicillin-insensitive murein endopeptidase [Photobacterium gaetbulicola]AJR09759.1 penicillin-insensitive murein endopeptidase [Photobacterium gaetbulicola Gung47]PSU06353.1 penicillin-insensitive murein endopeptidase [Photobacterium gaetbulicola]